MPRACRETNALRRTGGLIRLPVLLAFLASGVLHAAFSGAPAGGAPAGKIDLPTGPGAAIPAEAGSLRSPDSTEAGPGTGDRPVPRSAVPGVPASSASARSSSSPGQDTTHSEALLAAARMGLSGHPATAPPLLHRL